MKAIDRRETDADQLMEKARKDLKTSMFKRKPNYEDAVIKMENAAKIYAITKNVSKTSEAWRAAAEVHMQLHEEALAAKCLENLSTFMSSLEKESGYTPKKEIESNEFSTLKKNNSNSTVKGTSASKNVNNKKTNNGAEVFAADDGNDVSNQNAYSDSRMHAVMLLEKSAEMYHQGGDLVQQCSALTKALTLLTTIIKTQVQNQPQLSKVEQQPLPEQEKSQNLINEKSGKHVNAESREISQLDDVYKRLFTLTVTALENECEVNNMTPYKLLEVYRNTIQLALYRMQYESAIHLIKRVLGFENTTNNSINTLVGEQDKGAYHKEKNLLLAVNQPSNAAKAVLEIIVLHLTLYHDGVQARKELVTLSGVDGFAGSQEQQTTDALVAAFEENNAEELQKALQNSFCLSFIDASISRLAKKLTIQTIDKRTHDANVVKELDNVPQPVTVQSETKFELNDEKVIEKDTEEILPEEDLR